jgi:pyrroloquinoline quinone biosynthesis protein B
MTGPPVLSGSFAFVLCVVGALGGEQAGWPPGSSPPNSSPSTKTRAVVLGIAQDGGVPHIGCRQERCVLARRDPSRRERVACLGLVDEQAGRRFLIDATPDLPSQLESLHPDRPAGRPLVDGILLTHAHIGHYTGLMYLGREALGASGVPVYATPRMARFLRENGPWSQLVALGNVVIHEMEADREIALTDRLWVTPIRVPHRDELSDTVGFRVRGPSRSLLYIPDIDKWERWERRLPAEAAAVDWALLDGTFEDAAEIPGRTLADIPHPLIGETAALLGGGPRRARVLFVHLNHTNRLLWDETAVRALSGQGFAVARDGQELEL